VRTTDPTGRFVESRYDRDFPRAEAVHRRTLKLPVWHREDDRSITDPNVTAFRKVTDNYRDLLG